MQKLLTACLVLPFLFSCKEQLHPDAVQSLQSSLDGANEFFASDNRMICMVLEESVKDPQTRTMAIIWQPRGDSIQQYARQIVKNIDALKKTEVV